MRETRPIPAELRRDEILAALAARGFVRVAEIAEASGVSAVTARADIDELAASGLVRRVHGGAVPAAAKGPDRPEREPALEDAMGTASLAKRAIGRRAAALVGDGDSVFLDVGSTAMAVAAALVERESLTGVTVITNGVAVAAALEAAIPRLTVLVTGGTLRPRQHSLVDPFARGLVERMRADLAIVGCNGVSAAAGVTNINLPEAEIKAAMCASADRVVVVADAAKLGQIHLGRVLGVDEADLIVTDAGAADDDRRALAAAGARMEIVPPDEPVGAADRGRST